MFSDIGPENYQLPERTLQCIHFPLKTTWQVSSHYQTTKFETTAYVVGAHVILHVTNTHIISWQFI